MSAMIFEVSSAASEQSIYISQASPALVQESVATTESLRN
jgi:hypothetical protein